MWGSRHSRFVPSGSLPKTFLIMCSWPCSQWQHHHLPRLAEKYRQLIRPCPRPSNGSWNRVMPLRFSNRPKVIKTNLKQLHNDNFIYPTCCIFRDWLYVHCPRKFDKSFNGAAIALLMCVVCWTLLMLNPTSFYPAVSGDVVHYISEVIEHHCGDAAGTLFFLMGAMTIVEIVDSNGGFNFVRDALKTRSKRNGWARGIYDLLLSAILDNLTTSIVMIMVLRKLVQSREEYRIVCCLIIISANSGVEHSPIGDVKLPSCCGLRESLPHRASSPRFSSRRSYPWSSLPASSACI